MSLFLRVIQHLLPTGEPWKLTFQKQIRQFFDGLTGAPTDARAFADGIWGDAFPSTTREIGEWNKQFGLEPGTDDTASRLQIATAWGAQGGQSPSYLQTTLQSAGFPLYVHEWFKPLPLFLQVDSGDTLAQCGEPLAQCLDVARVRFAYDPRDYTEQPLLGTVQCQSGVVVLTSGDTQVRCGEPVAECGNNIDPAGVSFAACGEPTAQCNAFLVNEVGYLVNDDLTHNAPPPVPDDSKYWPYFLYFGAASFPTHATVPASRRAELERLVLKLRPAQQWVVMLVDYV